MSKNELPIHNINNKLTKTIYEYTLRYINGRRVTLNVYKGHICLIVNVASKSKTLTDFNYNLLNKLYDKYSEHGLRILAFPCNQFGNEEPGTAKDIINFAADRNVKFNIFEKIDVNGENAHPLWKFLKKMTKTTSPRSVITSSFTKFLINKEGVPVVRFGPLVDEKAMVNAVEAFLFQNNE